MLPVYEKKQRSKYLILGPDARKTFRLRFANQRFNVLSRTNIDYHYQLLRIFKSVMSKYNKIHAFRFCIVLLKITI